MEGTCCQEAGNCTRLHLIGVALPDHVHRDGHAKGVVRPVFDPGDQLLDLAADEVGQLDAAPWIRQCSLELLDRYLNGDGSGSEPVKRIQPTCQPREQIIGRLARQADCAMLGDEALGIMADGAVTGPEEGVAPGTRLFESSHQGRIPFRGPAADNEAILVQDTAEVGGQSLRVFGQFVGRIPLHKVRVVASPTHHYTVAVGKT
jgi:hypothetical protein